jgi:asparaginyl-tRNA synthetase
MATKEPKTTVYVDEEVGKDEATAAGTQELPFRTLPYAYIHTEGKADYLVKKAAVAPAEGEAAAAAPGFQGAAKAALKKAANALEQFKKKALKEKEQEAKRLKEDEARKLAYEEAKKIVIKEDSSLPAATKITLDQTEGVKLKKIDGSEAGTRVKVLGRVHTVRKQKDVFFIELKDGYGKMQCVHYKWTISRFHQAERQLEATTPLTHALLQIRIHQFYLTSSISLFVVTMPQLSWWFAIKSNGHST